MCLFQNPLILQALKTNIQNVDCHSNTQIVGSWVSSNILPITFTTSPTTGTRYWGYADNSTHSSESPVGNNYLCYDPQQALAALVSPVNCQGVSKLSKL